MKEENIKIVSECDSLEIDITIFIPKRIKGIIQFSHGMIGHKGHYYDFMKYFTKKGYVTIINDHRGHGKTAKCHDDLGYMNDKTGEYITEDLHQITKYIKNRFPNKKLILFGHSMGSLVVRKFIKKYDDEIDGLIVCGPPTINKLSKLGVILCSLLAKIKGDRYRSKNIIKLSGLPNNYDWISRDKKYVEKFTNDEYCDFIFTVNGYLNLLNMMVDVYSKKNWILKNKNLPIIFMAGSDDLVIKNEKMYIKSIDFINNIGYKNTIYKLYPNMRHALMFETDNKAVYEDILNFCNSIE